MTAGPAAVDQLGRPLGSLRVSVTDRCNMRCRYCMPEEDYAWLPRPSILTFEEIDRLSGIFIRLGVAKVRLTGGEPLLRHDLATLVSLLARRPGLEDMALTTNAVLLADQARDLKRAGLGRITVSLDTLRADRLRAFARSTRHADVLAGIDAALLAGFGGLKLNSVVIRGFNDDELTDLLQFGRERGAEVRFIEYMDVGGATGWQPDDVVPATEIRSRVEAEFGPSEPLAEPGSRAPADRFRLADGTVFGIIASTTQPFCRTCDRARLTADGHFYRCLYAMDGLDLREPLRLGRPDGDIAELIRDAWASRTDRGAEIRLGATDRGALVSLETLRADPHKEMHTRGG